MNNRSLFFGDNLEILREKFPGTDGYFDLVYLDPPFNSNRNYNVIFKEGLVDSEAQTHAFEDSWHWTHETQHEFDHLVTETNESVSNLMLALEKIIGHNDVLAYLTMMTVRLIELHRVLKPTGSIYLHCDPTASHYLKLVMDTVFGKKNFRNEIIWHYRRWTNVQNQYQSMHDVIFFYTKSNTYTFNPSEVEASASQLKKYERGYDTNVIHTATKKYSQIIIYDADKVARSGIDINKYDKVIRRTKPVVVAPDVWILPALNSQAKERLGYPTQKPEALLELILKTSTKEGDWVLDPFCGCGTTVSMSEKMGRNWVGMDISMLAVKLIERRLIKQHPELQNKIYINGLPKDMAGARELAAKEPFDFEYWVSVHLLDAKPPIGKSAGNMKGADKGIDGVITVVTDTKQGQAEYGKVIVQVKGGKVQRNQVSTLISDVQRERAVGGIFVSLEKPTGPMKQEAAAAGAVRTSLGELPKIQLLTVEDLLINGKRANLPGMVSPYKQALAFNPTIPQTALDL